ncbi:MAG: hypothetical protein VB021_09780 [Oscillospiraceae bacterium]|nr:hypothetical protein [Oscillospiraceae bacterium]
MAKMVGLSRGLKKEWLDKTIQFVLEEKSESEIKDELNDYLAYEIIVNGFYIGNTIQYAYDFLLFSKPDKALYESGNEIMSFSAEIGSMLQEIITAFTGAPFNIPKNLYNPTLHTYRDYNFKRKFKNIDNLLIFSLICRINFLLYWFKNSCPQNSMLYLRLIYITFYSLKSELQNLKIECCQVFDRYYDRTFRNCMAHYSLYQKIDDSEIDLSVIGCGLIEKYFHAGYFEIVETIEKKLELIKSALENYNCHLLKR